MYCMSPCILRPPVTVSCIISISFVLIDIPIPAVGEDIRPVTTIRSHSWITYMGVWRPVEKYDWRRYYFKGNRGQWWVLNTWRCILLGTSSVSLYVDTGGEGLLILTWTWISNYTIIRRGMKFLIRSQKSTVAPLMLRNGWVISPHTLLGTWLLVHDGIKVHVNKTELRKLYQIDITVSSHVRYGIPNHHQPPAWLFACSG